MTSLRSSLDDRTSYLRKIDPLINNKHKKHHSSNMDEVIAKLSCLSQKSDMASKHAACILRGTKPILFSHNTSRSYLQGRLCCSTHAEQFVIMKYFEGSIKWNGRKWMFINHRTNNTVKSLRKHRLLVIRTDSMNRLVNSIPCQECVKLMRFVRLCKILYSDDKGEIIKIKNIEDIKEFHTKANKMLKIQEKEFREKGW